MKTLYFDCFAGASGNMILGGIIALGVDKDVLVRELRDLSLSDFVIDIDIVDRSGISTVHAKVSVPNEKSHRHLQDIESLIAGSELSSSVKDQAIAIFRRLAEAEAKVHGIDIQKVHFHEVGAMDSILDVVGSCIGFELLGVEKFCCSKIHVGSGFMQMDHGMYPIPPPAVAELLIGVPIYSTQIEGELITPTAAAIISTLCSSYGDLPEMVVEHLGYGAGTREYDKFPNALRLLLGNTVTLGPDNTSQPPQSTQLMQTENMALLETNIDDVSPQIIGFVMDRAFLLGASDCWFTPIHMKKNRPATMISILCSKEKREAIMEMLYLETTTIGIRSDEIERHSLPRESVKVNTQFGEIDVKVARYGGKIVNVMPEYEHVQRLATDNSVPFRIVHEAALASFNERSLKAQA